MSSMQNATRAYAAASAHRSPREQEADIFLQVTAGLKRVRDSDSRIARVRALADNDRLWMRVIDAVRDPDNQLPAALRASLVSVGLAVHREMQNERPDFEFLISVNENVAAGLGACG